MASPSTIACNVRLIKEHIVCIVCSLSMFASIVSYFDLNPEKSDSYERKMQFFTNEVSALLENAVLIGNVFRTSMETAVLEKTCINEKRYEKKMCAVRNKILFAMLTLVSVCVR